MANLLSRLLHAARGLSYALRREASFRLELALGGLAVALAAWFRVGALIWATLVLALAAVLAVELLNTAFERLADLLEPRLSVQVRTLKDVVAAAVLIMAAGAVLAGLIVFLAGSLP